MIIYGCHPSLRTNLAEHSRGLCPILDRAHTLASSPTAAAGAPSIVLAGGFGHQHAQQESLNAGEAFPPDEWVSLAAGCKRSNFGSAHLRILSDPGLVYGKWPGCGLVRARGKMGGTAQESLS